MRPCSPTTAMTLSAGRGTLLWVSKWQPIHWLAVVDVVAHPIIGQTVVPAVVLTVEPTVVPSRNAD